jgi:1-acyl-sn-glycerol-3-phosphate acyltransferase
MYNIIRVWATIFLRLYFRRTIVYGKEHVPAKGPLIVASNHPSAFMEASVLGTVLGRPLHFLVRGDVFHPKFRWLFEWTNQIPIYRQKDGISNLRKNASSFELTYKKLAEGNAVVIFPEAKTTLEKKMRPIQRGTAHLAFGTLPYLEKGAVLNVIPVGVNFMNPRIPGADIVIQFGEPFVTLQGTREDRDAIEEFTSQLSDAMDPLIIQIWDGANEAKYDVLASLYMAKIRPGRPDTAVHSDLKKIADVVNQSEPHRDLLHEINQYIHLLNKAKMKEGIYFPRLFLMNRVGLAILCLLKAIWFVVGGWIWRLTRHFILSKIRTDTFQGPTSAGAAMVLFPVLTIIAVVVCFLSCISFWWILIWLGILALGKFIPEPISLMWKVLLAGRNKKGIFKRSLRFFLFQLEGLFKG